MITLETDMRINAVDHRFSAVSRRGFLLAMGLAFASRFTSIAGAFVDWLTRWCLFDSRATATIWQGA